MTKFILIVRHRSRLLLFIADLLRSWLNAMVVLCILISLVSCLLKLRSRQQLLGTFLEMRDPEMEKIVQEQWRPVVGVSVSPYKEQP